MSTSKHYPHVTGIHGDGGESEGALAVTALLDPGPDLPECARIIVGSPSRTPTIDGYIPDLGGFSCGPDAAERLIATLQEAVRDVRAAIGGPARTAVACYRERVRVAVREAVQTVAADSFDLDERLGESTLSRLAYACAERAADQLSVRQPEPDARAIEAMTARIAELLSERARDAQAFASPGARIANLEHELADLRESETTVQAERDAYRAMVCDLLASAYPHPTEHPTMTAAWAKARALLKHGPRGEASP
jgi:hypothetical protein